MPIYAFRCAACAHEFDRLQKLSDPDPRDCPACGASGEVGRRLTAPAFRLAGSGWYETDFKKDGDTKRNLADSGDGAKADGKSDTAATPATSGGDAAKPAATPAAKAAESKPAAAPKPAAPAAAPG